MNILHLSIALNTVTCASHHSVPGHEGTGRNETTQRSIHVSESSGVKWGIYRAQIGSEEP
jgi:hypothetical protein